MNHLYLLTLKIEDPHVHVITLIVHQSHLAPVREETRLCHEYTWCIQFRQFFQSPSNGVNDGEVFCFPRSSESTQMREAAFTQCTSATPAGVSITSGVPTEFELEPNPSLARNARFRAYPL